MQDVPSRLQVALADRYAIERELGHGGMATVYLARDLKHHRVVALKVLRPELAAVLGAERFLREIAIAAQLNHPHILPLFDSGEAGGLLYYVMPFVEGPSLRDRLAREKQLPVEEALGIARHVAAALSYAHSTGILHRDIKPENILLSRGEAVVADFGIARAVAAAASDRLTATGIAVGTPPYMSPEQAAGEHELDGRSDVYSLGCVLYEMLAGQPPFTGPTAESVLHQHLSLRAPSVRALRSTVPAAVEQALDRALAKAPADRFATAADLAAALDLSGLRSAPRVPLRLRRRWAVIAGVVGLAALAAAYVLRSGAASGTGSVAPKNSVAVLYFDNLSPDTSDVYLAAGLTEEIIARLGQVERLAVKSRNAVRRYRGAEASDPAALGRALGVAHLVSGSVRRSGGHLRVTIELVRAANGTRVWGEQYNRAQADLLAIEEDIGTTVATAVAGRLLPTERASLAVRPTGNPAAYDRYLRGNYYLGLRTPKGVARAIEEYEAALRLDPGFTAALARIALAYGVHLDWGWPYAKLPRDSLLARGLAAADRAVRQDSATSDAWMARGLLLTFKNPRTFEGARESLQRSIALDPRNAEAYHLYGAVLMRLGNVAGATAAYRHALDLDPERAITLENRGYINLAWRRYHEALPWLDSALAVDSTFYFAYRDRARARLDLGDVEGARADAQAALRFAPAESRYTAEAALASVEARAGDSVAARARVERLLHDVVSPDSTATGGIHPRRAQSLGMALVAVGDLDRAVHLLERARPRGAQLWLYLIQSEFDPIRSRPRFQRLVDESRPPGAPR